MNIFGSMLGMRQYDNNGLLSDFVEKCTANRQDLFSGVYEVEHFPSFRVVQKFVIFFGITKEK